ncbi:MAG: phage holin family protein [Cyclobacteriaceae bacterium]|tara:strand:- start:218 stop:565 length:348 start_codon:yes stop_codon:yes gene_type:complete
MSLINNLLDKLTEYIRLKGEKLKLDIIAQVSRLLAHVLAFLFLGIIAFFLFIFLSLALGGYLNVLLESEYYGYLIVAGVYLILLISIFLLLRTNRIQNWLESVFINISENIDINE